MQQTEENTVYDECGLTKSCFGLPLGCLEVKDCKSFGAVIVKDDTYEFEMQSSSENLKNLIRLIFD